jgi:hypothetical protein
MLRRRGLSRLGTACCMVLLWIGAARAKPPAPLAPFQFLIGAWEAVGEPAGATGGFAFAAALQDRVIVRTNYSITSASDGRPASRHDDLMTIYVEGGIVRADYFDNEGHVIRYVVEAHDGEVRLASEIKPSEPRYRLTYTRESATTVKGTFEIAPPGKPDAFAPYLSWNARRAAQ